MMRARHSLLVVALAACATNESATGPTVVLSDSAAGERAFVTSCAGCHASQDGYDLARFGFTDTTIIRSAVRHVDSATARRIVTYIRSLRIPALPRDTALMQPGTGLVADDQAFWTQLVGTPGWPATLSAQQILDIDPRQIALPFRLAPWSNELTDGDWMPNSPLPPSLLGARGGALQAALATYRQDRSTPHLLDAIAAFDSALATVRPCVGELAAPAQPTPCFESRRWMASLAGLHLLRTGMTTPPMPVIDLLWDTGEGAIGAYFGGAPTAHGAGIPGAWMLLAWSFAPSRFTEDGGYLGQFVHQAGYPRVAMFTALRRMVDPGPARAPMVPAHQFHDLVLVGTRAPDDMYIDALIWGYGWLDGWLSTAPPLDAAARAAATEAAVNATAWALNRVRYSTHAESPARLTALAAARDRVLAHLASLP
ncbi:MAG: hypothetical protein HY275_17030 [Gemmatimonadetes bacterium]|nr:hypothetical protein [Gemmatimonadota bacterium]